eukprot:sb/3469467/
MKEQNNTILLAYLNEYGTLLDVFMLHSNGVEPHIRLLNDINAAKDRYETEKKRMATEVDRGGQIEVDSGGGGVLKIPISPPPLQLLRHISLSRLATNTNITRSPPSTTPPLDVSTPNHHSSISGSSVSVASEHSVAGSSSSTEGSSCSKSAVTLSEIKEKPSDGNDSDEATLKCNIVDPESVKKLNDNFINLDINKDSPDHGLRAKNDRHLTEKDFDTLFLTNNNSSDT